MPAQKSTAVSATEARALFSGLQAFSVLVLAVSGGPDSTALMLLAARWRDALKKKPTLIAVTVDHGLRKESKREAAAVARLARKLKITHRTLRWQRSPQGQRRAHPHRTHARRPGGDSADPHEPR